MSTVLFHTLLVFIFPIEKKGINGAISKWSQNHHPKEMALCILLVEPLKYLTLEKETLARAEHFNRLWS